MKPTFRKDINSLRAIAVLAVIVFHYSSSYLQGGFIGVDVFFVISGFLMTGIIVSGVEEKQKFSVLEFYSKRAKQIIPALLGVVFTLLLIGFFIIIPIPYKDLGKDALNSLLFLSNWFYTGSRGYFALS